jgi:uncharacterized membrane protein
MNKMTWSVETRKIFSGILLFALAWIAYGIFGPIESLVSGVDTLASFAGSSSPTGGMGTVLSVITYILLIGIAAGYVLTIMGLGGFGNALEGADKKAIGSVRTAFILALVAVVLDALPFLPGIIGDTVYLVAIILMLLGYNSLKTSTTFPGRDGASTLFAAMILIMVGWVLDFIPLVGDWMESICSIIAYILTLVGWNKIKNAPVTD